MDINIIFPAVIAVIGVLGSALIAGVFAAGQKKRQKSDAEEQKRRIAAEEAAEKRAETAAKMTALQTNAIFAVAHATQAGIKYSEALVAAWRNQRLNGEVDIAQKAAAEAAEAVSRAKTEHRKFASDSAIAEMWGVDL